MQAPILINEPLLTPDMKRTWSGATQLFRKDYKDRQFTSEENADVVLRPPEHHLFAELIGGQWCWVNGCAECNGKPRDWMTYIECDKHDVCRLKASYQNPHGAANTTGNASLAPRLSTRQKRRNRLQRCRKSKTRLITALRIIRAAPIAIYSLKQNAKKLTAWSIESKSVNASDAITRSRLKQRSALPIQPRG